MRSCLQGTRVRTRGVGGMGGVGAGMRGVEAWLIE